MSAKPAIVYSRHTVLRILVLSVTSFGRVHVRIASGFCGSVRIPLIPTICHRKATSAWNSSHLVGFKVNPAYPNYLKTSCRAYWCSTKSCYTRWRRLYTRGTYFRTNSSDARHSVLLGVDWFQSSYTSTGSQIVDFIAEVDQSYRYSSLGYAHQGSSSHPFSFVSDRFSFYDHIRHPGRFSERGTGSVVRTLTFLGSG